MVLPLPNSAIEESLFMLPHSSRSRLLYHPQLRCICVLLFSVQDAYPLLIPVAIVLMLL